MGYKKLFSILLLFTSVLTQAQTGIGTTTPNASAKLDVYATNKGFLPPRVTLTSATDATTIATPAEGLLVYNVGSVGLQSGYYYWNGGNWATIATATSAGNGVTAMDMVKLYSRSWSGAAGNIEHANGYSFTVPVSGRYLFDFSSGSWIGNNTFTMSFKVRQETTDLATDAHTSTSNNVHAEYNGKVEVNLQAGVTYNVYVTGGTPNTGDYNRVYYKLVAGNLPVTGQTVEYGIARYTGADASALSNGATVAFDAIAAGNLNWGSNKFTLKANKTYIIESSLAIFAATPSAGRFQIYDHTNSRSLANGLYMSHGGTGTNYPNANTPMKCIVTPLTDIQVGIKLEGYYGAAPGIIGNASTVSTFGSSNASYFLIEQIGSSAIVNPWILSGNNSFNTTGNVGIGNSAPTTTLDVTGTGKFSASLINAGNRTYFGKDGSNMHWFATNDAIGEPNNLAYGFESNGTSIQTHRWYTSGAEKLRLTNTGKLGLGTLAPSTALHIENGNSMGSGDPGDNTVPSLYVFNNNNASSTANAIVAVRTAGTSGGKPYISFDAKTFAGFSMGFNNPTDQFIINTDWNFNTSTASKNAIIINETGQARVIIPSSAGNYASDFPGGWGGGLAAYDISCSGLYYGSLVQRSDLRLKNTINEFGADVIEKYLRLRPITYYWNQEMPRDTKMQYGLIAQEVEKLFPEMVLTASDSMQTKSVNYQALHAISLKVIQAQQQEIEALKKKQTEFEARLLKLEAKLN